MAWQDAFEQRTRMAAENEARRQARRSGQDVSDKMLKAIMGHMMQSASNQRPLLEGTTAGNAQRMIEHNVGALNTDPSSLNGMGGGMPGAGDYYNIGGFPEIAMSVAMQNRNHPEMLKGWLEKRRRTWDQAPTSEGMYAHPRFPQWWDRPY